ncbi:glycoside hydrolase family 13 [Candidatus Sumerlaeota bacterium]|nr:glycoside hydrolase family 13 [Candidatus Sumerlaeota bacterium]
MNARTDPATRTCQFCHHSPGAREVFLAGDFNGWSTSSTPMEKGSWGNWILSLALPPGRYEYKFIVDGDWRCSTGEWQCSLDGEDGRDLECRDCVPNPFGTLNHVIEVK